VLRDRRIIDKNPRELKGDVDRGDQRKQ